MPTIEINVRDKVAREPTGCCYVVCNNTDYAIRFDFDSEWDAYSVKTARFIWNCQYRDVVFSGTECTAPAIDDASVVGIGVFAGELRTTTPALIPCRRSILDGDGIPAPPSDDVYAQIMELLNDIETYKLTPVEKTDEMTQEVGRDADGKLYTKPGSGSGGTSDHRDLEHRDAADQHPMSAITGLTAALAEKGTYSKPMNGIPANDLTYDVQESLSKADSALQTAPVISVNSKTGTVILTPADLGIGSVFALKGSKPTVSDLPETGNTIGDVWYVVADSVGYIWLNDGNIDRWEQLGMEIDLSAYRTASAQNVIDEGKQSKITADGMLKGDGDGGITAAVPGTDYLTLATLPVYDGSVV